MANRIFITGGASGIGAETGRLFAREGWHVAVADCNIVAARALAAELGTSAQACFVDVLDLDSIGAALSQFCGDAGLDVLFNSAGLVDMRPWTATPLERQFQIFDVNVKGVLNCISAALPYLRKMEQSNIVTMCSAAGIYGVPDEAVYSASKFAVRALTEALNIEFEKLGVWVSDVMVSYVATPMVTQAEHQAKSVEILGVNVGPQDVAAVVRQATLERGVHWFVTKTDEEYFNGINAASQDERRDLVKSITGY